jgi:hypothetical protein
MARVSAKRHIVKPRSSLERNQPLSVLNRDLTELGAGLACSGFANGPGGSRRYRASMMLVPPTARVDFHAPRTGPGELPSAPGSVGETLLEGLPQNGQWDSVYLDKLSHVRRSKQLISLLRGKRPAVRSSRLQRYIQIGSTLMHQMEVHMSDV